MSFEFLSLFTGGTVLFLFSIFRLNSVIQLSIANRIKDSLKFAVKNKLNGLIFGIGITVFFQSSSATTVMIVSMVSAGLVTLSESLPIILGADIGTTLIAQLVVWKFTDFSPFVLILGLILYFSPEERWKKTGETVFYFGLLLFGFLLLSKAAEHLKESKLFTEFISSRRDPLPLFIFSLFFTIVVQSSSIPIGISIILAQKEIIDLYVAVPVVLGANLGTTFTAVLGSLVSGPDGKKCAIAHVIFKLVGVLVILPFFSFFCDILDSLSVSLPQKIAISHFLFNLFITLLFYPLINHVTELLERLIPKKGRQLPLFPEYLDKRCLINPDLSLHCVKMELERQMRLSKSMVEDAFGLLYRFEKGIGRNLRYVEFVVDNLESEIMKYLWEVSSFEMTEEQTRRLFAYTVVVHSIERIGDHALNISEIAEIKKERRTFFSDAAIRELKDIEYGVKKLLAMASTVIENPKNVAINEIRKEILLTETKIRSALGNHLERFYCKICRKEAGPLFVDVLTNTEGIIRHIRFISENLSEQIRTPKQLSEI
ncbi:MAG: Na/Pi cotransporter family protein [Deltaproteobacteria bacterium]|nr:Na/Pi cotransporter family protein [Deltaproteobacteria bacterium]